MLQSSDTIQACCVSTVLLPVGFVDPALNVSEPAAEDRIFVFQTLACGFVPAVVVCFTVADGLPACFPPARELSIAHAKQLCIARGIGQRYSHQLTNRKLMTFPKLEMPSSRAVSVLGLVKTVLNFFEQVYQLLGTAALFSGKTCELRLLAQNVSPAEILAEDEGGVDDQNVLVFWRAS